MKQPVKTGHLKGGGKLMLNKPASYKKAAQKAKNAKAFREVQAPKDPWGRK